MKLRRRSWGSEVCPPYLGAEQKQVIARAKPRKRQRSRDLHTTQSSGPFSASSPVYVPGRHAATGLPRTFSKRTTTRGVGQLCFSHARSTWTITTPASHLDTLDGPTWRNNLQISLSLACSFPCLHKPLVTAGTIVVRCQGPQHGPRTNGAERLIRSPWQRAKRQHQMMLTSIA